MFGNSKPGREGQTVVDTLIGQQVVIRGDMGFSGGLYVDGHIVGKVVADDGAQATLTLSDQGSIEGEVRAPVVVINGRVEGDVYASERVELAPNARVNGNIYYQVVEMRAGAQLTGRLVHASAETREASAGDTAKPALSESVPEPADASA